MSLITATLSITISTLIAHLRENGLEDQANAILAAPSHYDVLDILEDAFCDPLAYGTSYPVATEEQRAVFFGTLYHELENVGYVSTNRDRADFLARFLFDGVPSNTTYTGRAVALAEQAASQQ